ncbi:MAG: prephenate dehydrogenase/arogenate dehydrogenase family protein [Burkholderiales bacterium]|nr:prephenate dehydrogenase/arogenate dehydrogenase family protein [Burkholderiales bacterium]
MRIDTLVVTGVGLIGGSFALALKEAGAVGRVIGVGRGRANLEEALALGVIDEIAERAADAYARADFILVATPVGQMARVFAEIAAAMRPGAVVSDGGSTKCDVVALARGLFGARLGRFVPAHPIAGAELNGAAAARAGLYRGKKLVIAADGASDADAVAAVRRAWQACGARIFEMTPELHDRTFAAVSHLPHVLAFTLVDEIARKAHADTLFQFAASGFRDFTRIAGGSPEMWRDIALANRDALLTEIDEYIARLAGVRAMIGDRDGAALDTVFANARNARAAWLESIEAGETPPPGPREA